MGSICEYLRQDRGELPDYLYMPCWLGCYQAFRRAGPYGGFLGRRYDPLITECQPTMAQGAPAPSPGSPQPVLGKPLLPNSTLEAGLTVDRLSLRRSLLDQIDDQIRQAQSQAPLVSFSKSQEQAFDILLSSKLRQCFDLDREDPRLVDRYGRTLFGQSTLIARRLVEQGVRFVNVTWDLFWGPVNIDYDAWDTHQQNFKILKTNKLPPLDQTYAALMQDLDDRGLLDETLVVVMSEMGRTPRVNGNAGRDHWTFCYSAMLAGAGIRGGTVYGASDDQAAYVKDKPASTADICATIYRCLGIDPELRVPDRTNRPVEISHGGRPIEEILA